MWFCRKEIPFPIFKNIKIYKKRVFSPIGASFMPRIENLEMYFKIQRNNRNRKIFQNTSIVCKRLFYVTKFYIPRKLWKVNAMNSVLYWLLYLLTSIMLFGLSIFLKISVIYIFLNVNFTGNQHCTIMKFFWLFLIHMMK